ncbi:MAG: hypothetical protein ABII02_04465, partial [Candidatus Magasanikbacteria bacterium]
MEQRKGHTRLPWFHASHDGQGLIEAIIAMAVFAMFAASLTAMAAGSLGGLERGGEYTQATALAQEGLEAIKSIREEAWNELVFDESGIEIQDGLWQLLGTSTSEQIGQFTRVITFENVCRDGSFNVTACPGLYTDPHTKKIFVAVSWETRPGVTNNVNRFTFITNWDSNEWTQTDWIGGEGQTVWSDESEYDSDDGNIDVSSAGQVSLSILSGGCGETAWSFTTDSNYAYDTEKIEVADGKAQLVSLTSTLLPNTITDSLEFDIDKGLSPDIIHVSGDIYAIAYEGDGSEGYVKTVSISDSGSIGSSVIDTL